MVYSNDPLFHVKNKMPTNSCLKHDEGYEVSSTVEFYELFATYHHMMCFFDGTNSQSYLLHNYVLYINISYNIKITCITAINNQKLKQSGG